MHRFFKDILNKINKLDDYINRYKENAGEVSMPSYAYMNWGVKLLDEGGSEEEALKLLEKSVEMPYANSDSYVNLGIILAKENKFDLALEYLKKATKLDNENSKAYQIIGSVYSELNKFDEAKKAENVGCDLVSTTLSGYTKETEKMPNEPDFKLLEKCRKELKTPVILEGKTRDKNDVKRAFELGAHSVVIGSMVTRPHKIIEEFKKGLL